MSHIFLILSVAGYRPGTNCKMYVDNSRAAYFFLARQPQNMFAAVSQVICSWLYIYSICVSHFFFFVFSHLFRSSSLRCIAGIVLGGLIHTTKYSCVKFV